MATVRARAKEPLFAEELTRLCLDPFAALVAKFAIAPRALKRD